MGIDQEALPVAAGDVVRAENMHALGHSRLEERLRYAKGRTGANRDSHELPVLGEIVELAAVGSP